jgi:glutamate-1-semialdehyde 2,1-aminomutase
MNISERLHASIPGGCHTYSRGDSQFPANAPHALISGKGAYVYGVDGKEYLDYGMGLRSVAIGYGEPEICTAAIAGLWAGNCLTRPSVLELEAAELACSLLGIEQVKFTKNGSTATTAAVKLARAATGHERVACARQPFFSYDDWFIGTTTRAQGVLDCSTVVFDDANHLDLLARRYRIACAVLEPKEPYDLKAVREICDRHGIVLIFDEMITAFRYDWPSVAMTQEVKPDLSCYGKAIANGFSVAFVGGLRSLMEQDVFLASTTHGAEMCGLAAFIATVKFMERENVSSHLKYYKKELDKIFPTVMPEKTLFMQELCKRGVLMPWVAHSFRHSEKELALTKTAVDGAIEAIANGIILEGPKCRSVF